LVFTIFPLIYLVRTSFFDWRFGFSPKFNGLANYVRALGDERVLNSLRVTVIFVVATVTLEMLLGLGIAVLFNRVRSGLRVFRGIITFPLFCLPLGLAYIFLMILHEETGFITHLLHLVNLPTVPWLSDPSIALLSVVLLDVYQWTPFAFIIILAGLSSLSKEPFEAAKVDGASGIQIFQYITIPMLAPVLFTTFTLKLIFSFKIFDFPYNLTQGGPALSTEVFSMYIHRQGLGFFNLGYSAALSVIFLIIVLVICLSLLLRMSKLYD
jgi:multiple sugar transport system permease protein